MLTAQVQIAGQAKPLPCVCPQEDYEVGDHCIIELDGRSHFGTIVRVPIELPWSGKGPRAKVLRRAGTNEDESEAFLEARQDEWLALARKRAAELKLELKFVRCDLTPGGKKTVFSFVADGRIDFRELVRDLSRDLRCRVELKQIGARDAAALAGGIGHCGQPLCCSRFLDGFAPVSMKLAKQQGLPLNPSKISGQCGRLMCCLRYEVGEPGGDGCGGGCASKQQHGRGRPAPPAATPSN